MFDRLRHELLRVLHVPPAPEPPSGAPGSVRLFRAGHNFYRLCLLGWLGAQIAALIGLIVSLSLVQSVRTQIAQERNPSPAPSTLIAPASGDTAPAPQTKWRANDGFVRMVARSPSWVIALIIVAEAFAVLLYIVALPITYAAVRLDYELRWYVVTDRSLRIRTGLLNLQETTMSFANLQQVVVAQGPLQRLLGVADVKVQSAGGGGGDEHSKKGGDSLHTGIFRGVDNAAQIRDLILERLRSFREAGLGDPDDHRLDPPSATGDTLAAAQLLLEEARSLRRTLTEAKT